MLVFAVQQHRSAIRKDTFPPSWRLLHPPSHPCRPSRSPELSSLGSTAAPCQLSVSHAAGYGGQGCSSHPSYPVLPLCVGKSALSYVCASRAVLCMLNQFLFPSQICVGISLVCHTFRCQKLGIFLSSPQLCDIWVWPWIILIIDRWVFNTQLNT